jgi:DNA-binding phage protein
MKALEEVGLTASDIAVSRYNVFYRLDSEERISSFLEAAIKEAPGDLRFYGICLIKAAKARTINQLAKETGADRKALCDMFLEYPDTDDKAPEISREVVVKVSKAFAVPVPV